MQAIQEAVERVCADARGVLLIPENHTRNMFYLRNVATLEQHPAAGRHARAHRLADARDHAPTKIDLPTERR